MSFQMVPILSQIWASKDVSFAVHVNASCFSFHPDHAAHILLSIIKLGEAHLLANRRLAPTQAMQRGKP